jgi:hypothetical protein
MTDPTNCTKIPRRDFLQIGIGAVLGSGSANLRREVALGLEQLDRGESAPWDAAVLKDKLRSQYIRTAS